MTTVIKNKILIKIPHIKWKNKNKLSRNKNMEKKSIISLFKIKDLSQSVVEIIIPIITRISCQQAHLV